MSDQKSEHTERKAKHVKKCHNNDFQNSLNHKGKKLTYSSAPFVFQLIRKKPHRSKGSKSQLRKGS